jgi:hypothetical protein
MAALLLVESSNQSAVQSRVRYWPAVLLYVCALLSKTITCTLPVVLVLIAWWKHGQLRGRDVLRVVPLMLIGACFAVMTVWMEHTYVGARGTYFSFTSAQRFLIAGRALWFYPAKLLWPHDLCFFYPKWPLDVRSALQWSYPISFLIVLVALYLLRSRIGRAPFAVVMCYAVTIAPALGFVNVYPMRFAFVADHYQYLASIAWFGLTVGCVATWTAGRLRVVRKSVVTLAALALLIFAILTWRRAQLFANVEVLWRDTLRKNSASEVAHNNLGNLLTDSGRFDEGIQHYRVVLALNPNDDSGHFNLAATYMQQNRIDEAIPEWREAVRVRPRDHEAYFELGRSLESLGDLAGALASYQRAIELQPDYEPARLYMDSMLR